MSSELPETPDEVRKIIRHEAEEVCRKAAEDSYEFPEGSVHEVALMAVSKAFEAFANGLER